jgi:hypothetical protein
MLDTDKIPTGVLQDIAQDMGWKEDGSAGALDVYLPKIAEMTAEQAFERWCDWHGLFGWATSHAPLEVLSGAEKHGEK